MFAEMLMDKLPMLIQVFAISVSAFLTGSKGTAFSFDAVITTALTIFSVINVISMYAPKIKSSIYSGMGYGIGSSIVKNDSKLYIQ